MSCCIIAEVGVNHGACFSSAVELIGAAAVAGANVVKFQTYRPDELTVAGPHRDMLEELCMPLGWYPELKKQAESLGLEFMSSPFDIESAKFLRDLGVSRLKIPSGELTNLPFLSAVSALGLPMIVSTGMATMHECRKASAAIGRPVSWLHCVSVYPTYAKYCNLEAMETLRVLCDPGSDDSVVGFSDHTTSLAVPVAAVARGAMILEKHITLSQDGAGPDHHASFEPDQFANMVDMIRDVEASIGNGIKVPTKDELDTMPRARRAYTAEGFKRNP